MQRGAPRRAGAEARQLGEELDQGVEFGHEVGAGWARLASARTHSDDSTPPLTPPSSRRRLGPISAMGTRLRRCNGVFGRIIGPGSTNESSDWTWTLERQL